MTRQLSIQDAAKHFNVSERTIRRRIKQGKLKASLVEGRYLVHVCLDNDMTTDKSGVNVFLVEQLQSEIAHLRGQLARRYEQVDHLTQLLVLAQKNIAQLSEQLEASRQMIEDMRHSPPLWKRIFRRFRIA